jgi:hypothetical protein
MTHFEVVQLESLFSFDYWPMDYDESWPEDGEAKVYVDVQVAEPDLGIPHMLHCFYFIKGVDRTHELSKASYKDMHKQAAAEYENWKAEEMLP